MTLSSMFELKIVAESNLDAIKTIERLFTDYKIKELKVSNGFNFKECNVYTVIVYGNNKKLG